MIQAVAEELHELPDDTLLAEHLGDRQNQVRRRGARRQFAPQFKADHLGNEHGNRLAQHRRLGFNAAHAPAQDAQAVDHGGMGIRAHQGVRIGDAPAVALAVEDHPAEVFQVDLVHDPRVRRHHLEVAERLLTPPQERIPLPVALEFDGVVALQRPRRAEVVHLHRVIDDQLRRRQGIDGRRPAAQLDHCIPHGRKIHDRGHPGEVLENHARGGKRDLGFGLGLRVPGRQRPDIARRYRRAVLVSEEVFQQNLERVGKPVNAFIANGIEAKDIVACIVHRQALTGSKGICHLRVPQVMVRLDECTAANHRGGGADYSKAPGGGDVRRPSTRRSLSFPLRASFISM